jgi:hypothetical protein
MNNIKYQFGLKKIIIILICVLVAYMFFFDGIKIIRANLDNNPKKGIQNATFGYMERRLQLL